MAEDAARPLPNLPLEDALQLVRLYADQGSPKYERRSARRIRHLTTEPYRPRTNGKVERFHQTMARE
jgi:transposase InsO family protein